MLYTLICAQCPIITHLVIKNGKTFVLTWERKHHHQKSIIKRGVSWKKGIIVNRSPIAPDKIEELLLSLTPDSVGDNSPHLKNVPNIH